MPNLSGNNTWSVERIAVGSTTDWEGYVAATWVRFVTVRNEHGSASLYVGNPGSSGAFSAASSEYVTIPAGGSIVIPVGAGPSTNHRTIPLASGTASHPVAFLLTQE